MKAKNNKGYLSILFTMLVFGAYLRLYNLGSPLLWQDEAETAFYAKQIVNLRLPNAFDEKRDLFLYIGALIPILNADFHLGLIDPNIYGFVQEDFDRDGTLIKHPYGDILVTALSFFMFGASTFSARFLFALIGVFSLLLTYKLGKYLYDQRIGLISMAFQTFNIVLIAYERQARHYSLGVGCFLGALYFILKALEEQRVRDYLFSSLFLTLLIYSRPVAAISLMVIIFLFQLYRQKSLGWLINKKMCFSFFLIFSLNLPSLFFYQPWKSFQIIPEEISFLTKISKMLLIYLRFSMDLALILVVLGGLTLIMRRGKADIFTILVLLIPFIIFPLLLHYSSFYERVFLFNLPFMGLLSSLPLAGFYDWLQKRDLKKLIKYPVFLFVLFVGLLLPKVFSFPFNLYFEKKLPQLQRKIPPYFNLAYYLRLINDREPFHFLLYREKETQWVKEAISFFKNKRVGCDEWIFTTYQNTTFLFYSGLKVQLIWPIRKNFIDSYQKRFWIVIGPTDSEWSICNWFYKFSGSLELCENRNYFDRIKNLKPHILPSGALIYECNPRERS